MSSISKTNCFSADTVSPTADQRAPVQPNGRPAKSSDASASCPTNDSYSPADQSTDTTPPPRSNWGGAPAGSTVGNSPQALAAALENKEKISAEQLRICKAFLADRHSLDDDPAVEWVEGWHGVRKNSVGVAIPGIIEDQGLLVLKPMSFMPSGAYWHKEKPETPDLWPNSGAYVHFRIPKVFLESMGEFVDHPQTGCRFDYAFQPELGDPPRSKADKNKNIKIMPIQIMDIYWVAGSIPEDCKDVGKNLIGATTW